MQLTDFVSPADLESLADDAGRAFGLPGNAYRSDFYTLEQETLFPRRWCAVAYSSDLPDAGDVMPVALAGWPLLLVRGAQGELRAFHNVCRHRGMQVVSTACKGRRNLVCPWHSWTYALDGSLERTPRIGGQREHRDAAFDSSDVSLRAVPAAEWLDMVFVNLDANAGPFEAHIQPLATLLQSYDFSEQRVGGRWTIDYSGNWKITVEGAIEDYHLPYVHGQLVEGEVEARPRLDHGEGCFFSNSSARAYADESRAGEAVGLTSTLPWFLDRRSERRTFVISVFPTGFIFTRPNYLVSFLIRPLAHDRTHLDFRHYYQGDAATDPKFAAERDTLIDEWRLVFEQDFPLVEMVQRNHERPGSTDIRTRFSPFWEANVLHFQRSVVAAMAS